MPKNFTDSSPSAPHLHTVLKLTLRRKRDKIKERREEEERHNRSL